MEGSLPKSTPTSEFTMTCPRIQVTLLFICLCVFPANAFSQEKTASIDFVHEIVPVLKRNCTHCHGGREAEGEFSLNSRAMVIDSGMVDLDDADDSYLLELILSDDPDYQMPPPDRHRMRDEEVTLIRRWISEGLPWDDDFTFAIETYEAPLRPRSPELPAARDGRDHPIDRILDQYTAERNLPRPQSIDDARFLRRVSLDLIGLLPTEAQLDEFVADSDPEKRERLIDTLLADEIGYADHWLTFFNDLLRNDYSGTGFITGGRKQISTWLYASLLSNQPFDAMVRELIAPPTPESQGYIDGIKWRGEVSAGQTLPIQFSQSISQSFLGINMKCASCHDSFTDRWTLKEAYGLAAIYANESMELHRCDKPIGETAEASWLFPELGQVDPLAPREQRMKQLADLMTHPENGRFARTIVNRLWYRMMGRGIVHPLDSMQNEPWNEDLLDYLASDLVQNGFDLKSTLQRITTSAAYQSESEVVERQSVSGDYVYRGPWARRMTAEQFLDSIWQLSDNAPQKFDAPVVRRVIENSAAGSIEMPTAKIAAQWIWGSLENGVAPGGERLILRKQITLDAAAVSGGAVLTCDNRYELYVNGNLASQSKEWTDPQVVFLSKHLVAGENTLEVIVTNDADHPNAAGFFMEGRIELADESHVAIASDATWQFNPNVPTTQKEKIGSIEGAWQQVTLVPPHPSWAKLIADQGPGLLADIEANGNMPMVRSSLLKNTALMKSLGRPMREQIVSMRPDTITTLEAIDLANEPTLAESFAVGAKRLKDSCDGDLDRIIEKLFRSALARPATTQEHELVASMLGADPDESAIQDVMWAVCMLPEFLIIQ